jgi:hypothetical protein
MRHNNDREDDHEEYPGDSTAYYQAYFVSFGSPTLSTLDTVLWGTYMICLDDLVGTAKLLRAVGLLSAFEAVH